MAKEVYRIEIPIETTDKYSDGLKKAEKDVKAFESTTKKASKSNKELGSTSEDAAKSVSRVGTSARGSERDVTRFQSTIQKTRDRLRTLTSSKWELTIRAVDHATRVISGVNSFIHRVAGRSYNFTMRAVDMASRALGGIRRAITSIPAVVTIALSVIGVNKLKEATVGAAMNFEDYGVAMNHWLKGDQKAQKELMTWMGRKADKTPYNSADIFPAMTGAVALAGNDPGSIQRLTSSAIDMAALSGGQRSVEDAMQALTGAKMGNFQMMKGFGMQISKKDYDKMGWEGFIKHVEGVFQGGAEALAATGRGQLSTINGYMQSQFRMLGDGILEGMKPRLQAINDWLDDNQDKWGAWKDTLVKAGHEASEWAFSKLETGFNHIKTNYLENDDFKNLDFKGKIEFIMADISGWWSGTAKPTLDAWWESSGKPWAAEMGLTIGEAIFEGIKLGLSKGLSTLGDMWGNVNETAKEHGVFSKETATSAGGAGVATLGAGALTAMVLSPLLKGASGLFKGVGKVGGWAASASQWVMGKGGKGGTPPVTTTPKPSDGGKQTATKQPKPPKAPVILDQYGKPLPPSGVKPASTPKPTPTPKPSKLPKLPKGISGAMKKIPLLGTLLSAVAITNSTKEGMPGAIGALGGGLAGAKGGAMAGAAIGSVVPGVGTAIGAGVGGLVGGIGGSVGGEWLGGNWDLIKEKAADAAGWIGEKFNGAKEAASATLFNGEWWGEKWEGVKQTAASTVFSANWWAEQAGFVFGYLESTLFNGEWWSGHWDAVNGWASEKWEAATEIWEAAKVKIDETLFSGEWWGEKWGGVKDWTSAKWEEFSSVWETAKSKISETLFSSEWWSGKWGQVKGWAQSAWENIKGGFTVGQEKGREAGSSPPKYALGTGFHPGGPAIVGDGGGSELIRYPGGGITLSPSVSTLMNLPRGTSVLPHRQTEKVLAGVPAYADGIGFNSSPAIVGGGGGSVSAIHVNAPVSVTIEGSATDEEIINEVLSKFGKEMTAKLLEALANR